MTAEHSLFAYVHPAQDGRVDSLGKELRNEERLRDHAWYNVINGVVDRHLNLTIKAIVMFAIKDLERFNFKSDEDWALVQAIYNQVLADRAAKKDST